MIHYIIQVIAFQVFFLLIYDVFLKKETFFNWNRAYLLVTAFLSVLLPFIKVDQFKNTVPQDFIINLPQLLSQTPNTILLEEIVINGSNSSHSFLWYITLVLCIGIVLALSFFLIRLFKIIKLTYQNPKQKQGRVYFVNMLKSTLAFSFFNYVFLGEDIKETERKQIVKHELVHVNQKHTWDLLFFELLRIGFWFNPLVYMYQNRIADLHEFIADSQAVKRDKKQYYENLLSQVFDTNQVSFINPFFKQSLIKKRIIMLQKSKSKQVQLIKYALLIPMVLGMLVYSSCSDEASTTSKNNIDLSKYGYTLKLKDNGIAEVPADKHEEYETFLKNNPEYVAWAQKNLLTNEMTYSVHSKDERIPDGLTQVEVSSPDGKSYVMFINFPNSEDSNSEPTSGLLLEGMDTKLFDGLTDFGDVPFATVDQVPIFPGCEKGVSNEENKLCLSKKLNSVVATNFNTDLASSLNLNGVVKIYAFFKISKTGKITDIKVRAPKPELEAEVKRVLNMLPDLIPAKNKGKKVTVPYYLPIKFQINE